MTALHHSPADPHHVRHSIARTVRSIFAVLFLNPFALVAAALAVWLVTHVICLLASGACGHADTAWYDVLACTACVLAVLVIGAAAIVQLVLTFLASWREK